MYYQKWANVDEDDFDAVALLKEGLQSAAGVFFATWVLTYTICHYASFEKAAAAAAAAAGGGAGGS